MEKTEKMSAAEIAEKRGIQIDTLRKRWNLVFPQRPFDRYAELSVQEVAELTRKPARKIAENRRKQADGAENAGGNVAENSERGNVPAESAENVFPLPVSFSVPQVAEIPPVVSVAESLAENARKFDFRLFLIRSGLWVISVGQVMLLVYGANARFGDVGFWIGIICGVFLFVVNLAATDARFWGASDTGFWVALLLAVVFGALHFYTFQDYLILSGSLAERRVFAGVSAAVIEVLGLTAMSLQAKISNEA